MDYCNLPDNVAVKYGCNPDKLKQYEVELQANDGSLPVKKETPDSIFLEVSECPVVRQLLKSGLTQSPLLCNQNIRVNEILCSGTFFESKTEITNCGKCRQAITRQGVK